MKPFRCWWVLLLVLAMAGEFVARPLAAAPKSLYTQADFDQVKKWHLDITGQEMATPAWRQAISRLDSGAVDLEELRRGFVNSTAGREHLTPINRVFWGFLARPVTTDETTAIEELLGKISGDLGPQVDTILNNWEKAPDQGITGANLLADLKKCRTLQGVVKAVLWSDEYLDLRIKDLYQRYLGREADGPGLGNKKKLFRERGARVYVPEFWRKLRMELVDSGEGRKRHPNHVDRVFLKYRRRYPSDGDRSNLQRKSEEELIALLDASPEAVTPRIEEVYRWIFGREADSGGLKHWTDQTVNKLKAFYAMGKMPGQRFRNTDDHSCPVLQLIQEFAQVPPEQVAGIGIAQMSVIEEIKGRASVAEAEKNLPDEMGREANQDAQLRALFAEFVLREPTDHEVKGLRDKLPKNPTPEAFKQVVLSSKEFAVAAQNRAKAFESLYQEIFYQPPDPQEAGRRLKELNAGTITIKSLQQDYLGSDAYKAKREAVAAALAKGELLPFPSVPLSAAQAQLVKTMQEQLQVLHIDYATVYHELLGRPATEEESRAIVESLNKTIAGLHLTLLPEGKFDVKSLEAFRKTQTDKLKSLPKLAKDALEGIRKKILASPEFKGLAETREANLIRLFQDVLGRTPTEADLKSYLDRLGRGEVTFDSLKAELQKLPEYAKYQAALQNYSKMPPLSSRPASEPSSGGTATETENIKYLKDLSPFANIDWADKISLSNVKKKTQGDYTEYTGEASFFWAKNEDFIVVNTLDAYGNKCWLGGIMLDGPWSPDQCFNNLDAGVAEWLKLIQINGGALILSSSNLKLTSEMMPASFKAFLEPVYQGTKVEEFDLAINLGPNLLGRLSLSPEPLKEMMKQTKLDFKEILFNAFFPLNPKKLTLRAYFRRIPVPDWIPGPVKAIQPSMDYQFQSEIGYIRLRFSFPLQFEGQEKPLAFEGLIEWQKGFSFDYKVTGGMSGMWENALGIEGFSIGNLFVKFQPYFCDIMVKGTMQFGTRIVEVSANPQPTPKPFPFKATLNELNLDDFVVLGKKMNIDLQHEDLPLPQIGLRDLHFMASNIDDPAMGLYPGFRLDGRLLFNNEDIAKIHIRQWKMGPLGAFEMQGQAKPLDLGPIQINSGTPGEGPMVDVVMKPNSHHAFMKGKMDIFGSVRETQVYMTRKRILIEQTQKLWDAYQTRWRVEGSLDLKKPAFGIEATMQADFLNTLMTALEKATKDKIPEFVRKNVTNAFAINQAGFKGSLDACMKGTVPGFWIDFKCLGKTYTFTTIFHSDELEKGMGKLTEEMAREILAKLEAFAKEMEVKIKEAVKKAKEKIAQAIARIRETLANLFKSKKKDSGPTLRPVDARFICEAIFF